MMFPDLDKEITSKIGGENVQAFIRMQSSGRTDINTEV